MRMRLLITGGSGLLGSSLAEVAVAEGHQVFSGYCRHSPEFGAALSLDLLEGDEVERAISEVAPQVIFHTAALTDVDRCEDDPDLAWRTNVLGTERVARAAAEVGAHLVYVSTDYVFDGEGGMYREEDRTDPVNCYGRTKLSAEGFCDFVGRTSVIYGARPASGKVNFALWLIERLAAGEEVRIVTDQFITPTLNTNLARMLLEAGERRLSGVYHMAGATRVSRYDFAVEIARAFGLDEGLIAPSRISEMRWRAKRPRDSSLDTSKAARLLAEGPSPLRESLRALREEIGEGDLKL